MEAQNSIASNLVYQRKLKGLTQKDLSDKTNVTVRTIQRIEKGETEPHLQTVKLLAAALEIEIDELIPLQDPKRENIQKKWLLMFHSTPFIGFVLPFFNVFIPLFLWIHKREDNEVYYDHGRKVINFQISLIIYILLIIIPPFIFGRIFPFYGSGQLFFLLLIGAFLFAVIVMIFNIYSALKSNKCYYPLAIPFISKKKNGNSGTKTAALIIFFLFSCVGSVNSQNIERIDGSMISEDSLTSHIEYLMEEASIPGAGVSVFNDSELVYSRVFGHANNNTGSKLNKTTNIYGASLSKTVFTVIVMKLVEENLIDLDTPLESYLPKKIYEYEPQADWHDDYSDLKNDSLYHKITARMCLAHTSGFPNWRFFEADKKLRVKHEPGSKYLYSGEGMVYLQVVLEKLTGKRLEELARKIIFDPLKLNNSSYQWRTSFEEDYASGHNELEQAYVKDKDNEPRAPSTLETTFEDYTKFIIAVMKRKILTDSSWNEIFTPQVRIRSLRQFGPLSKQEGDFNDEIKLSYGLGMGLYKTPYGWAATKGGHGSGFEHGSALFPESGKAILILTNSENGESIFKELFDIALKDTYLPWEWKNYIPYNSKIKS